jgi:membrane-associated HD superfamily phosphohydrolase
MFRLMKYEYRRNLAGIVVMLSILLLAQGYYLFAVMRKEAYMAMGASMILVFISLLCVLGMLIFSVALYARELSTKSSYLTFMTPSSMPKILGAKLIAAFFLGAFFAAVITLFAVWDVRLMIKSFPDLEMARTLAEQFAQMLNTALSTIITNVVAVAVMSVVNFLSIVMVAYLAITLGATALQNRKLKGLVSFVLFVGLIVLLEWGVAQYPDVQYTDNLLRGLGHDWPTYATFLAVIGGSFALSAWLLEKKVSL